MKLSVFSFEQALLGNQKVSQSFLHSIGDQWGPVQMQERDMEAPRLA